MGRIVTGMATRTVLLPDPPVESAPTPVDVAPSPSRRGTLLFGGRTPLGPLRFHLSVASNDDWQVVLGIGRPIEEGAITDPVW